MILIHVINYDGDMDEWPGCFGTVAEDESLVVVELSSEEVKTQYAPDEWISYQVRREDR